MNWEQRTCYIYPRFIHVLQTNVWLTFHLPFLLIPGPYYQNTSTLFYIASATNTAIQFIPTILTDVMLPA
jgi:hypothetical protein